jgi:hypothetical protein
VNRSRVFDLTFHIERLAESMRLMTAAALEHEEASATQDTLMAVDNPTSSTSGEASCARVHVACSDICNCRNEPPVVHTALS